MRLAPSESKTWGATYGPFLTLGLQLSLTVLVFFFLGKWLDGALGSAPWLMLAGIIVGIAGGMVSFVRKAMALGRQQDQESKDAAHDETDQEKEPRQ
jgi:F0F1-type ATP synthase assembly protein I